MIKPLPLYSQRPALDNYSLALNLLLISPLLSPITEYTVDELELGNLNNLDNLDAEKDIKDTILSIVDYKEALKEASSKAAKGIKKQRKTAKVQEDKNNKDI